MHHSLTEEQRNQIIELVYTRQKIQAIKEYRNSTGCDLREAKNVIDQLTVTLENENPEGFRTVKAAGCGASAVLFLAIPTVILFRSFGSLLFP